MNGLLVKFHTLFLPELSEGELVWDDLPDLFAYQVDERWSSAAVRRSLLF